MKTDEMAAELAASEYHGAERGNWGPDFEKGFISGCKHKNEQLSSGGAEFDEKGAIEYHKSICIPGAEDNYALVVQIAKWQHAQLAPIINAQADRLKAAEGLISQLDLTLRDIRIQDDDRAKVIIAISEIEKFRKGEG